MGRQVTIDETHGRRKTVSLVVDDGPSVVALRNAFRDAGVDIELPTVRQALQNLGTETPAERIR